MTHVRRIRPKMAKVPATVRSRESNARLEDRRLGGMVLVDYLFDLFAASPFEVFSRVSVLSVLDQVKRDQGLFPSSARSLDDKRGGKNGSGKSVRKQIDRGPRSLQVLVVP
jgi:hypothetical protein